MAERKADLAIVVRQSRGRTGRRPRRCTRSNAYRLARDSSPISRSASSTIVCFRFPARYAEADSGGIQSSVPYWTGSAGIGDHNLRLAPLRARSRGIGGSA